VIVPITTVRKPGAASLLVRAESVRDGLSDPDMQPKFQVNVPNPLAPDYVYGYVSDIITISMGPGWADTGLVGLDGVTPVSTPIWGYGRPSQGYTWPGRTLEVQSYSPLRVRWLNRIPVEDGYLLTGVGQYEGRSVVDTTIHNCFNMPGYENHSVEQDGTPTVPHLHGGHTDAEFDGNSEAFFTPRFAITGPAWPGQVYHYDNSQPATALWYHDHALGLTRYVLVVFPFLNRHVIHIEETHPESLLLLSDSLFCRAAVVV
jgi:spore coat protein A, manganese oxidase